MKIEDEDMAALLRRMTTLRRLDASHCNFGPVSMRELLAEEQEILTRTDGTVQAILSSCSRLKKLRGCNITVSEIVKGTEWVCIEMTEMSVILEVDVDMESLESMQKQRVVFKQLGRLTRLEHLYLTGGVPQAKGFRTLDLRLRAGLDELVNLKHLRWLSFIHDKHQQIQSEDATWIVTNWPSIEYCEGVVNRDPETQSLVTDILKSHNVDTPEFDLWE
ncbi:hypothetical protein BX616_005202 [Lobosporangium transversale]|nr:hypothetical protein BX616_005202 [Lobosporangium transversale]